jgi:hypothetical protein
MDTKILYLELNHPKGYANLPLLISRSVDWIH